MNSIFEIRSIFSRRFSVSSVSLQYRDPENIIDIVAVKLQALNGLEKLYILVIGIFEKFTVLLFRRKFEFKFLKLCAHIISLKSSIFLKLYTLVRFLRRIE